MSEMHHQKALHSFLMMMLHFVCLFACVFVFVSFHVWAITWLTIEMVFSLSLFFFYFPLPPFAALLGDRSSEWIDIRGNIEKATDGWLTLASKCLHLISQRWVESFPLPCKWFLPFSIEWKRLCLANVARHWQLCTQCVLHLSLSLSQMTLSTQWTR